MKTPTFEEQYQKIVSAYYKNQLKPADGCACFIGNLLNGGHEWEHIRCYIPGGVSRLISNKSSPRYMAGMHYINDQSGGLYTPQDILDLENNFLKNLERTGYDASFLTTYSEDSIYRAMVSTLEMLRRIHESKGEIVKDYNFTKRELQEA